MHRGALAYSPTLHSHSRNTPYRPSLEADIFLGKEYRINHKRPDLHLSLKSSLWTQQSLRPRIELY